MYIVLDVGTGCFSTEYFLLCTLQRWQRSSVRQPPQVTVDHCTLSVMTCPCCLPNPAHSTSTQKTRKTSRVDWMGALTTARTATQVQPGVLTFLPSSRLHPIMILQVRRRTSNQGVICSAAKPAVWREEQSFSLTDRQSVDQCWLKAVLQAQSERVHICWPKITAPFQHLRI